LCGAFLLTLICGNAAAAEWTPSERISLVTHSSPGTGNELMLREIADIWNKNKFVPKLVSVESVTGSQGEKARRYVITQNNANPHLLAAYTPASLNNTILTGSDSGWRKFTPIAMMAYDPLVLLVNADGPYQSLQNLVTAAKEKPKSVLQGGGNYGNSASMAGKILEETAGVSFSYVPFKGGGDAVLALMGKHIHLILENPAEVVQHVKAGKLKALAVSERLNVLPDVPTFEEAGYKLRLLKQFRALMAPPGISAEVTRYYIQLLDRTRGTPQWKDYLTRNAITDGWMTGEELAAFFEQEEKMYLRLDSAMGLLKEKAKK
jgi:putative tricarboxylic transport membrane protein